MDIRKQIGEVLTDEELEQVAGGVASFGEALQADILIPDASAAGAGSPDNTSR